MGQVDIVLVTPTNSEMSVRLPDDAPVSRLLPVLVQRLALSKPPEGYALKVRGSTIPSDRSLGAAKVLPGERLILSEVVDAPAIVLDLATPTEPAAQPPDMLTPETISNEVMEAIFKAAYLDVSVDSDGDLIVKETYKAYVTLTTNKTWVRFTSRFRLKDGRSRGQRLEFANRVNENLHGIHCYVDGNDAVSLDYYLSVEGGIGRRALVAAARRHAELIDASIGKDTDDVVVYPARERGDYVTQAIIHPDEVRRFTANLRARGATIGEYTLAVNAHLRQLGESWRDGEYTKFTEEMTEAAQGLQRFIEACDLYAAYLIRKAAAADEFLRTR